ncbi:hypothetical protein [Sinorhizobium meliloti]|uniref:hypothetical protein n=1 Tax=Rhizobium meliloti TaxID=382 RepID=UPI0001E4AB65|nr:hypothetical protein [Sinorhizobium meliloti]AEG53154.1 hypothetical protein Sinme_1407 [Sinorhizobium meliloti AK83]MDE4591131.1 hypothetical protein [Sinorhizobium meliloti]SEI56189.1 hypothetical protein SAMN04244575_01055 [Sinorhizobium meliloti]
MSDEPTPKRPLEERAFITWAGAQQGRFLARLGLRSSASARLEPLQRIENDPCPRINRLAQDAARDIRRLMGLPLEIL